MCSLVLRLPGKATPNRENASYTLDVGQEVFPPRFICEKSRVPSEVLVFCWRSDSWFRRASLGQEVCDQASASAGWHRLDPWI
jgi:hypothetical protein